MSERNERDCERGSRSCGPVVNEELWFWQTEEWKRVDEIIVMTVLRKRVTGLVLNKVVSSLGWGAEYFELAVSISTSYTGFPEKGSKPY